MVPNHLFDAVSVMISALHRSISLSWLDFGGLPNMCATAPTAEIRYKILPPAAPTT
jgi:hypothetical protein